MVDKKVIESQSLVIDVFKGFRDELLAAFGNIEHDLKSDQSQVTQLDIKIEKTLKARLTEAYPEFGFQGEETGKSGNDKQFWLVDPIDGTSSFIRGLPACTNMAAFVDSNQSVIAVIYDFIHDILYTATKGGGAFKNQVKMQVDNGRAPNNLYVYLTDTSKLVELRNIFQSVGMRCFSPFGASGHFYVLLSEGKIDGCTMVNPRCGVHDNAPGVLLATEAGCQIIQLDDKDGIYMHEFIIGSPNFIAALSNKTADLKSLFNS